MKKLTTLITQRQALLQQARLANLAFAYATLGKFGRRIARARLTGSVTLTSPDPEAEHYWAALNALDGRQSVIEEHFADEDLMDLADVLEFITGQQPLELTFRIEEFAEAFLAPVREELKRAGVEVEAAGAPHDAVPQDDHGNGPGY